MRYLRHIHFVATSLVALACTSGYGDDKPVRKTSLMEKKLACAQKVLDGLTKNDFNEIKENAGVLNDLSKQAAWKLIDSPRYEMYSDEFQRITLKMMNQAKDKNLDGATLSYVDMDIDLCEVPSVCAGRTGRAGRMNADLPARVQPQAHQNDG